MKCKQCGWENPDNRERCEKCGNVLLRQRPFETPAAYDDQRAANNPVSRDYGNVYGNVDSQFGPRPYAGQSYEARPNDGGAPVGQPYGPRPYVGQPYEARQNDGEAPAGQPYGPRPYAGQPYETRQNDGDAPAGQPYGLRPYAGQSYDWLPSGNDVLAQQQPSSPIYTQPGYDGRPQGRNAAGPQSQPQMREVSYCPECDAELPAGATECPVCHAVIRHESIEVVSVCRDCGTEVMPGQKFCHGCGARLNVPPVQPAMPGDGVGMQPDVADKPAAGVDLAKTADSVREETAPPAAPAVGKDDDTVLAGPLAEEVPECMLQLVAAEVSGSSGRIVECVGREVDLYRDNTDPANNTIARDLQARLTYAGGKWSIEDCSALRTTYIRPGRKIELCDGDVIVMGNREFIFKSK